MDPLRVCSVARVQGSDMPAVASQGARGGAHTD